MAGDDRRIVLLASEPATGLGLDDADALGGPAQEDAEGLVHVVRALQGPIHGDPIGLRDRDHPVRFDVELFLVPRAVLPLDHEVRLAEPCGEVTLGDRDPLEHVRGPLGIQDWVGRRVVDPGLHGP